MIRRPPRSTQSRSSAASDVYKRQPTSRHLKKKRRAWQPRRRPSPPKKMTRGFGFGAPALAGGSVRSGSRPPVHREWIWTSTTLSMAPISTSPRATTTGSPPPSEQRSGAPHRRSKGERKSYDSKKKKKQKIIFLVYTYITLFYITLQYLHYAHYIQ